MVKVYPVTAIQFILQVFDDCALSQPVKDELYKCYPNAKRAHLKKGGNFPYLCRSADVNLYLQVCVLIICKELVITYQEGGQEKSNLS